ncbi:MAG: DUF4234 domain-containing protein [Lachnospiraceae bacterium]|nr:DUF4234 domain-containing protein [Lachnospiraceae bacterium]
MDGNNNNDQPVERVYDVPTGNGVSRNIALCIILSIITCGIYTLYWIFVANDELNSISGDQDGTSGGLVLLFIIITCGIYGWYWNYKMGEKVDTIKNRMGIQSANSSVIFLLLDIFGLGIVSLALMQDTINRVA